MILNKLRPLQWEAVEFVCERLESLLLFQQRLGKTWIAIGAIDYLMPTLTLIVVPLGNIETTWAKLIRQFLPQVPLLTFPKKLKKRDVVKAIKSFARGILLIHFEAMPAIIKWLRKKPWDFMIVDELHRCKDRASLTSRTIAKMRHVKRKLGLTGTPLDEEPSDLWAQLRWVAPNVLGTRWKDFDEEYNEQPKMDADALKPDGTRKYKRGSFRWKRALMIAAMQRRKCKFIVHKLPKFLKQVKGVCWRAELPSPEPEYIFEWVHLLGYQRDVYRRLDKKSVVELKDGTQLVGSMPMTRKEKLNQICGGYVIDEVGETHRIGSAKQRRLKTIIRRRGAPAAIFCRYTAEVEELKKILPGRVGVLSGAVKSREIRARTQEQFQNGKLDYIICQTKTGGVGIDLYRAKYLIVYSTTYSLIDFDQLVARIRLPEQTEPVKIILILAINTVDEEKYLMIRRKRSKVTGVLSHLRRGRR